MWIRTKSISCQEFFHGMQEIVVWDTPVTLFMGEDEQRPLAERVARFLPKVCGNYTIIDTKEFALKGISPEFRGTISHLVMHGVNNRVDAYMELFLRHRCRSAATTANLSIDPFTARAAAAILA